MTNFIEKKMGLSLENQREVAKMGLVASLASTAVSAFFMKSKAAKSVHIASGVALIAFSLWHHSLYPKNSRKGVKNAEFSSVKSANSTKNQAVNSTKSANLTRRQAVVVQKRTQSPKK